MKKKDNLQTGREQAGIAGFLSSAILKIQFRWSHWMQRQTEKLSAKGKLCCLLAGVAIGIIVSGMLIRKALYQPSVALVQISGIKPVTLPPQKTVQPFDTLRMARILQFKRQMDSLAKDPRGSRAYERIIKQRPGLMDSLRLIEQTYVSQSKK